MRVHRLHICLFCFLLAVNTFAQSPGQAVQSNDAHPQCEGAACPKLTVVSKVDAPSELAQQFGPPLRCDKDGNLFLHGVSFGTDGFRKLSPKGERLVTFSPNPDPKIKVDMTGYFALREGELYSLVLSDEKPRYVFVYGSDGKYKSAIKLDVKYPLWSPSKIGVFKTGEMLISGQRYARDADKQLTMVPFTGLFRADGTLLKEITLEDDASLHEMARNGDSRYATPGIPGSNRAISFGQTDIGDDGNIYLMRWTSPAIVYVVSPAGEVVRRFEVDPEDPAQTPMAMHVSGNRLAVKFMHRENPGMTMKIVGTDGQPVATYRSTEPGGFGAAFACWIADKNRFTFLSTTKEQRLRLTFVEPR